MNETGAHYAQQHSDPRLQEAYNSALLQFQKYLLEKMLAGEARLTKANLLKMLSCN